VCGFVPGYVIDYICTWVSGYVPGYTLLYLGMWLRTRVCDFVPMYVVLYLGIRFLPDMIIHTQFINVNKEALYVLEYKV
jgi:hypothetical protein